MSHRTRPRQEAGETGQSPTRFRMKDLIRESGLSRETIHFYIAEGLLPAGQKTSRTTAEYTKEHVERLQWIRHLCEEQFLPLRAVKAVLRQEEDGALTSRQRTYLRRAAAPFMAAMGPSDDVPLSGIKADALSKRDLQTLEDCGLIQIKRVGRRRMVSADDAEIVEVFANLREAGFTRERGYSGAELTIFDQAMENLVERELQMALGRLVDEPAETLREIAERANPFLEHLMLVIRRKKIRLRQEAAASDPEGE